MSFFQSVLRNIVVMVFLILPGFVQGADFRIGEPVVRHGMSVGAMYIQAVTTAHDHSHHQGGSMPMPADMHLEAIIHATKDNKHGFKENQWIPYLTIIYQVTKKGSDWSTIGTFMPMAANNGPHYAANVKLNGAGKYQLKYRILPPSHNGFTYHIDKETGVDGWWSAFDVSWDFKFMGVGKKGGY